MNGDIIISCTVKMRPSDDGAGGKTAQGENQGTSDGEEVPCSTKHTMTKHCTTDS